MNILRPCPFCGGKAVLEKMGWPHHVYCVICGARVTSAQYAEEGEKEAIEKWNRRIKRNEEQIMDIFRYACMSSPPGPWALPKNGFLQAHPGHYTTLSGQTAWGWVDYSRELTDEETEEYGLQFVRKRQGETP